MYALLKPLTLLILVACCAGAVAANTPSVLESHESAEQCRNLASLYLEGYDFVIESATHVGSSKEFLAREFQTWQPVDLSGFQSFCRVIGYFERRVGVDESSYAIGFGITLPDKWNGRFLFQGGGGMNGSVREPLGEIATGETPALFRGFAVVTTDSGHQSDNMFNTDFFSDQQALLNFYSEAVAKTTRLTRKVLEHYYNRSITYSYFAGCSTGGREAMTMSQRYPMFYDGIIAGAPALQTNYSRIGALWAAKQLRTSLGDKLLSSAQQQAVVGQLLAHCDANDGLADGIIMDVPGCSFEATTMVCADDKQSENCLAVDQAQALQAAFDGPRLPSGENVYPGFYYDTGIAAAEDTVIPGLLQGVAGPLDRLRGEQPFDLQNELDVAMNAPLAPGNPVLTDLSAFTFNGRKIMFYHGVSDPWFSARDTLRYFLEMTDKNGGPDRVSDWAQFYFVPGMGHCHGGESALDKFDMLSPLIDWVESGRSPVSVTARGTAVEGGSRPLCPYPAVAHYLGAGDTLQAESFACRASPQ